MNVQFKGTGVAVTTPFNGQTIDYGLFEEHLNFLINNNVEALIINGTTAEGSTLTEVEKLKTIEIAVRVAQGRVPVIAGTGTNNTQASIDHSLKVKALGVDGIMLITPYYNKTSQRGLIAHFTTIADAVELPVLLYNVPARTNMTIEPETVVTLAAHPFIYGIKDATGDMNYMKALKSTLPEDFSLYSGNDDAILPFYEAGGAGVISVIANVIPAAFSEIYRTYQNNRNEAERQFNNVLPLIDALSVDVNPIPIKALVTHIGYANGELRLPLVPMLQNDTKQLIEVYNCIAKGSEI
ncbi:4-hydroxy-tetrahydrodipicolinate synthase [Macrococcoides canis]|uniref:4-hydroxy-tetrahydrodipicolinate synthase n=1 Tax=Macrococcoides canis TaxID=1855823 RepID=UPI001061CC30|nr:4-hydroxy-tetrahydrodipicolinate synthase [Macrococcus canis]TDM34715.1 4-hydroxy-tetrahydrodipicolinate synthase [Macrococcus canis]